MGHPFSTRIAARTVVVGSYVVLLALVGQPGWLAAVLGVGLVAVWAAPFLLASNRRRVPRRPAPPRQVVRTREAGPS